MHVMILGAGVTGVSSAWYLRQAGFDVSVIDRQPASGQETSFANGGQISVSHPEPWSNPATPLLALRSLGRRDAPLRFHPRADPAQWLWALSFLRECLPRRFRHNTAAIAALAVDSGARLRALRAATGISYDQRTRGILHLFFDRDEYRHAPERVARLQGFGIAARRCDAEACIALEPALRQQRGQLLGGIHAPDDESGDACLFTQALTRLLLQQGAVFHHDTLITTLQHDGQRVTGVDVVRKDGTAERLQADAYVVCLGSYSPMLVAPLGERLNIYPVKGYSLTAPVADPACAPEVSLTDESRRIVCSRLGERLRIAGTAELSGYNLLLRPERVRSLLNWVEQRFPGAIDPAQASPWCGLRPATPGNLPIIGRSRHANLWLNTGHGTLGWTLACGSAAALAELMQDRRPAPAFPFHGLDP